MKLLLMSMLLIYIIVVFRKVHRNRTIGAIFSKGAYIYAAHTNGNDKGPNADPDYNLAWLKSKTTGYTIDESLSFQDATVYVPPSSNQAIVIAYRGTDFDNYSGNAARDLATDAIITAGNFSTSSRVNDAVDLYYRVRSRYPYQLISITGHSLGGSIADNVARRVHRSNDPAFYQLQTFNKGSGAEALGQAIDSGLLNRNAAGDRVAYERMNTDLVSAAGKYGTNTNTYNEGNLFNKGLLEAHNLKYFYDRDTPMNLKGELDAAGKSQLQKLKGMSGGGVSDSKEMEDILKATNNGVFDPSAYSPMQIMNPIWWVTTAADIFAH